MIIYVPVFENGRRSVAAIDTEKAVFFSRAGYGATIIYHGRCYNGDNIYTEKEAVNAYWNKNHKPANVHRIPNTDCKWRAYNEY